MDTLSIDELEAYQIDQKFSQKEFHTKNQDFYEKQKKEIKSLNYKNNDFSYSYQTSPQISISEADFYGYFPSDYLALQNTNNLNTNNYNNNYNPNKKNIQQLNTTNENLSYQNGFNYKETSVQYRKNKPKSIKDLEKQNHDEAVIQYFIFSNNKQEILQCLYCVDEDQNNKKKIILDQFMAEPIWKIRNIPYLNDKEKEKQVRKQLENNTPEKIAAFKKDILQQIEKVYHNSKEKLLQALNKQKKDIIQQFELLLEKVNTHQLYDIETLKKAINNLSEEKITLDDLFKIQLEIKDQFESQKQADLVLTQEKNCQNLQNQVNQLQQQLEKRIQELDENMEEDVHLIFNNNNKPNTKNTNNNQQQQQQQIISTPQKTDNKNSIQFYKSNFRSDKFNLDEITISNQNNNSNNNKQTSITFDKKTIQCWKQAYSQVLDKNKTHHLKFKIDYHGTKNQQVLFSLLDQTNKDEQYLYYNYIYISDYPGNYGSKNGVIVEKKGKSISEFMRDNETIYILLNILAID
ncbi:hypothetical protein PPERSA_05056 [Pseudocohnilembus persalinus]|uniref:Uncharacterized protein n=1 Tax=Pseudocohnilembus persalinus TaxID=266149 RepID=A0A0V0QW37_PSEPJ|nr:hypothetical protein PPERSA_05056 [Pseudocohnilembus persalinus]|eukprot:KRX06443.1 hypothetical protein PPERSA_05056 [Pseudocohnilembus persalinus]